MYLVKNLFVPGQANDIRIQKVYKRFPYISRRNKISKTSAKPATFFGQDNWNLLIFKKVCSYKDSEKQNEQNQYSCVRCLDGKDIQKYD